MKQTVTPKFVNAANAGKKYGSIKGQDDTQFMVPASMVSRFTKGQTYEVEVEEQDWGGKTVWVVKNVGGGQAPAAPAGNGHASGDKWFMPFVSNTVAHAIAAGQITDPSHIKLWAAAAKQAAQEIG